MGESDVSIVLLNSVSYRSSSLSDVHLAAFTGNPVNYAILEAIYNKIRPRHKQPPKIYGLPIIQKGDVPLRPIVSFQVGDYAKISVSTTKRRCRPG